MNYDCFYAVDIGGTSIKIGIIADDGQLIKQSSFPTDPLMPFDEFSKSIAHRLLELANSIKTAPIGIGVSAPGYPDPQTGRLIGTGNGNVPVLREASIAHSLSQQLGVPSTIENDGVCAALGELEYGVGKALDNFVILTIGTGIGGAIVLNRQVLQGDNREPAELGAMVLQPHTGISRKGIRGSFEDLSGAKAVIARYSKTTGIPVSELNMNILREQAESGDGLSNEAFNHMCMYIAQALGTIINLTGLKHCVIGGGVSNAGNFILDRIEHHLIDYTWPRLKSDVKLMTAINGNNAGLIGAMSVYRSSLNQSANLVRHAIN